MNEAKKKQIFTPDCHRYIFLTIMFKSFFFMNTCKIIQMYGEWAESELARFQLMTFDPTKHTTQTFE